MSEEEKKKTKITEKIINMCRQSAPDKSCEKCTCNIQDCLACLYLTLKRIDMEKGVK